VIHSRKSRPGRSIGTIPAAAAERSGATLDTSKLSSHRLWCPDSAAPCIDDPALDNICGKYCARSNTAMPSTWSRSSFPSGSTGSLGPSVTVKSAGVSSIACQAPAGAQNQAT
jgi:hypothetical protein